MGCLESSRCRGYLTYLLLCSSESTFPKDGARALSIDARSLNDVVIQCAQEILSLFVLGVAARVQRVVGTTSYLGPAREALVEDEDRNDAPVEWINSTFDELSREVLESGLAEDLAEARTLIIPAFNHYGLLPTEPNADENSLFSGEPDEAGPSNSAPLTRPGSNDEPSGEAVGES